MVRDCRGAGNLFSSRGRFPSPFAPLAALLLAGAAAASATEVPLLTAAPLAGTIALDGILDEPAWDSAAEAELTQSSPEPGAPTPYATRFRILADRERIYVGIICRDPEPRRITGYARLRDGNMDGDDRVALALDTFGDGRTGYLFQVNAVGTLADGLIAGAGTFSYDWDGLWNAAVKRDANGWSAEIELPARSLQFTTGLASWGLNVTRIVPRDRTELLWASPTLDSALIDLARAGRLEGTRDLVQGWGLSVVPYALARHTGDRELDDSATTGDVGGEVYYNLTPQLQGVLTVNTDFAETEVDALQSNLTRFPLFFPEKRGFFLEGSNLFDFGLGLEESFLPFYSRRIGLFEGDTVPIDAGLKLQGRAGRFGVALLDVQTGDSEGAPATNLFASRLSWESSSGLRLGGLVTNGDPDGVSTSRLFGADAVYRTSKFRGDKNLEVGGWVAKSESDPALDGQSHGYGFRAAYPNDLWNLSLGFQEFGDQLDPALGFLPRLGIRRYDAGAAYQPRPAGGLKPYVRQLFFELFPSLVTDLEGRTESWRVFMAPVNVSLQSGDRFEANWAPQFERLDRPFEISPGVVIPPGDYQFSRYRLEAGSSLHRPFAGSFTWWFGDFFGGKLDELTSFLAWGDRLGWVAIVATWDRFVGDLPEGDFDFTLSSLRLDLAFSRTTNLSLLTQYDSTENSLGGNLRFRWTPRPGTDLFLVWARGYVAPPGESLRDLRLRLDGLTLKLRWTLRR